MVLPLSERQERILKLIVRNYIETGIPVGSRTLVKQYRLDISPATVRNEMAMLGDLGYLVQLHTSAVFPRKAAIVILCNGCWASSICRCVTSK